MTLTQRWRIRLAIRKTLLARARKRHEWLHTAATLTLVNHRKAQVAQAQAQLAEALPLRLKALAEAFALLARHVYESNGNNRGPVVDQIIKYAGGDLGESYCVDTQIYIYGHAGSQIVKPGYTRAVRYMLVNGVTQHALHEALPGYLVRYVFDHTGILVYYCDANGKQAHAATATHIKTIEGNTSAAGAQESSDGKLNTDGVHEKIRPLNQVSDFLSVSR